MRSSTITRWSCLLIGAVTCAAMGQTGVRVATWNVETVGSPGTTEYDAALDILDRIGADVVGINEVNGTGDTPNFESLAAAAGYPHTVVPTSNPFGGVKNAFMSKLPITAQTIHTSADLSGDPSANDITRLIISIAVDVPGNAQDLTLAVNHWKSGTANSDEFRRAGESFRVAQTVAGLDTNADAYVFMGDVNEEIDSVPRTPNPFTSEPTGLPVSFSLGADLVAEMNGPGIENNPFFYLERIAGPEATAVNALQLDGSDGTRPASGRRLDYLFVSQFLVAQGPQAEVYDSTDEGLPGGLPKFGGPLPASTSLDASDHLMVFMDVTVPGGGCSVPADCDDGLFCNGQEDCVGGNCVPGSDPCGGDPCDEVNDVCLPPPTGDPWINEFHYDNQGGDTGEFVEIAGPAGTNLTDWTVVGYNGNGGGEYKTITLSSTIPDQQGCIGTLDFTFTSMQNGSPDGLALVDPLGTVVEFISYEGSFTASDGPAAGMTSTDIGVSEPKTTPVGESLQLSGTGSASVDFTWQSPAPNTRGLPNTGQTFDGCGGCNGDPECDDGLFCNGAETCVVGACQQGTPVDCDDGVACTDDSCNEATDSCDNVANDGNCDNGLFCDGSETCDPAFDCQAGTSVDCDDGVGCTDDSCNEAADSCDNITNDGNCDDGLFCTGAETCDALLDCQAGTAVDCDDGVGCTDDSCNEATDSCDNITNDANCDDGLFCNGVETCDALLDCQAGGDPCPGQSCDEVTDSCVDCQGDGDCDDGLFCNGAETCVGGTCQSGTAVDCDDGVGCTDDSCNESTDSCDNVANDGNCDNGLFCDGAETCDPALDCEAGTPVDCDDGVGCTDDSCNETTDSCDNVSNDANCDNGLFCDGAETCDPAFDCQAGADPCPGQPCDEVNDQCLAGPSAQLETGSVTVGGTSLTVILANSYSNPVVVCSVQYDNNTIPVVTRVSGVTSGSFDVRLQNPSGGAVAAENVSYIVVEEGTWNINGISVEAQTYSSTITDRRGSWNGQAQSYGQAYGSPVVVGQVMSENDFEWSAFWCRGSSRQAPPSASSLFTGKTVCEDTLTSRADETVGFIVFESGHGTIGGVEFEAALGADIVRGVGNSPPYTYSFNTAFATAPTVALTTTAAMDGNDGAWAQAHGQTLATSSSLFLSVDEDQIRDSERRHTTEQVGYVVFAGPVVYP